MSRRRKIIWLSVVLLVLAGGIGGYWWYWQSTAIDRKVCQLVYEAAGYPDTKFEKWLRSMKLDFLIKEKPKPREYDFIHNEILEIGHAATPSLLELLNNDAKIRICIVLFLGSIKDVKAIDPLIYILKNDVDSQIRSEAALSLAFIGDKKATEPLIEALTTNNSGFVQLDAAYALGELGDSRAEIFLEKESLKNGNNQLFKQACHEAIAKIKFAAIQSGQAATTPAETQDKAQN